MRQEIGGRNEFSISTTCTVKSLLTGREQRLLNCDSSCLQIILGFCLTRINLKKENRSGSGRGNADETTINYSLIKIFGKKLYSFSVKSAFIRSECILYDQSIDKHHKRITRNGIVLGSLFASMRGVLYNVSIEYCLRAGT